MLGTCWYLSNGFQPGERPVPGTTPHNNGRMLPGSGADASQHETLKTIEADKAKGNNGGVKPELGKIGD